MITDPITVLYLALAAAVFIGVLAYVLTMEL